MEVWWSELSTLNQWMYGFAAFFGSIFTLQIVLFFIGFDEPIATDLDTDMIDGDYSMSGWMEWFSAKAIIAFGLIFSLMTAVSMDFYGVWYIPALLVGFSCGVTAGVAITYVMRKLALLQESGNVNDYELLGCKGEVLSAIRPPESGQIEVHRKMKGGIVYRRGFSDGVIEASTEVIVSEVLEGEGLKVLSRDSAEGELVAIKHELVTEGS